MAKLIEYKTLWVNVVIQVAILKAECGKETIVGRVGKPYSTDVCVYIDKNILMPLVMDIFLNHVSLCLTFLVVHSKPVKSFTI